MIFNRNGSSSGLALWRDLLRNFFRFLPELVNALILWNPRLLTYRDEALASELLEIIDFERAIAVVLRAINI